MSWKYFFLRAVKSTRGTEEGGGSGHLRRGRRCALSFLLLGQQPRGNSGGRSGPVVLHITVFFLSSSGACVV